MEKKIETTIVYWYYYRGYIGDISLGRALPAASRVMPPLSLLATTNHNHKKMCFGFCVFLLFLYELEAAPLTTAK